MLLNNKLGPIYFDYQINILILFCFSKHVNHFINNIFGIIFFVINGMSFTRYRIFFVFVWRRFIRYVISLYLKNHRITKNSQTTLFVFFSIQGKSIEKGYWPRNEYEKKKRIVGIVNNNRCWKSLRTDI